MSKGNERFNAEAAAWDSNPEVHRASQDAKTAILKRFPDLEKWKNEGTVDVNGPAVLEIGCGTGLLSFPIAPYCRSLLAVDASTGMIDALKLKLEAKDAPSNIHPLCVMLVDPEDEALPSANGEAGGTGPRLKFDLIFSHLCLHHIADLQAVLTTMYGCLKPGGRVALTDFENFGPEARRFHPESRMDGVEWHGIHAKDFAAMMKNVGFVDVDVKPAWMFKKDVETWPGEWGNSKPKDKKLEQMDFPFLLCVGQKTA